MSDPRLVPELDVTDLERSLAFYRGVLGFAVRYDRPEEAFAYLELDGAELMLQAAAGPGRRFRTADLDVPFGRGVNFQLEVDDVDAVLRRVREQGTPIMVEPEMRRYRVGESDVINHQIVVADPDGYLWRCFADVAD
jgi:catechol 2,3-dioxygenase-like lactoylglutathione lyase family enzyme